MSATTERSPSGTERDDDERLGHLVSPENQMLEIWVALCGKRLKGRRLPPGSKTCPKCLEIAGHRQLDLIHGPGWRN